MGFLKDGVKLNRPYMNGRKMNAFVNGNRVWAPSEYFFDLYPTASPYVNTTALTSAETRIVFPGKNTYFLYNKKRGQWVKGSDIQSGDTQAIATVQGWQNDTIFSDSVRFGVIEGCSTAGVQVRLPVGFRAEANINWYTASRYLYWSRIGCMSGDVLIFTNSTTAVNLGIYVYSGYFSNMEPGWTTGTSAPSGVPASGATISPVSTSTPTNILSPSLTGLSSGTVIYQAAFVESIVSVGSSPGFTTSVAAANRSIGTIL